MNGCADGQQAFEVEGLGRGLFSFSFCQWLQDGAMQGQARVLSPEVLSELTEHIETQARLHKAMRGQRPWINPQAQPVLLWKPAAANAAARQMPSAAALSPGMQERDQRLWRLACVAAKTQGVRAYEEYLDKAPAGAAYIDDALACIAAAYDGRVAAQAQAEIQAQQALREAKDRERLAQEHRKEQAQVRRQAEARARREAEEAQEAEQARRKAERERAETLRPGRVFREAPWAPEMVVIPAGRFMMGSSAGEPERDDDEGPRHEVTIARPFAMGRYAVTFEEYDVYAKAQGRELPSDKGWGRGRRPVINVSWDDAQAYVQWLNAELKLGNGQGPYRLPSEAEWEYAARGGTTTAFWWGDEIDPSLANYDGNYTYNDGAKGDYREQTMPADSFEPNPYGLHCVHGNVWEWVQDRWHDSYEGAPGAGNEWCEGGDDSRRVQRGGPWDGSPRYLRAADRDWNTPGNRIHYTGFRIARTL